MQMKRCYIVANRVSLSYLWTNYVSLSLIDVNQTSNAYYVQYSRNERNPVNYRNGLDPGKLFIRIMETENLPYRI